MFSDLNPATATGKQSLTIRDVASRSVAENNSDGPYRGAVEDPKVVGKKRKTLNFFELSQIYVVEMS